MKIYLIFCLVTSQFFLNQNLEYGHHVEKRCNFDDKGSNYIKFLFQDGSCLLSHQEEIIQQ